MKQQLIFTMLMTFFLQHSNANEFYKLTLRVSEAESKVVDYEEIENFRGVLVNGKMRKEYPATIVEHNEFSPSKIIEYVVSDKTILTDILKGHNLHKISLDRFNNNAINRDEKIRTIVNNGSSAHRIDLVFMGDGYLSSEEDTFNKDVERLTAELFDSPTFQSYLPLFNVHAVFKASEQSGIGKGRPKNTAYRLYREGNTLRAIFPGDQSKLRQSCRLAPGCDYPIVVANDDYYGGLGGEFAITTRSIHSGSMVLRHELGHNFGRVGEEYDGGNYFGANHARSINSVSWKHWINTHNGAVKAQPAKARFIDWPWHNLAVGPFQSMFTSDGRSSSFLIVMSVSGAPASDSIQLLIDNTLIPLGENGYDDRRFINIIGDNGFSDGRHSINVLENEDDGNNWLSSLSIHEYAHDYDSEEGSIGAYPLFNKSLQTVGYRSNHETCLMRNMTSTRFCSVCQENMWLNLLEKVSLIDQLTIDDTRDGIDIKLHLLPLDLSQLDIRYFHDSRLRPEFNNKINFRLSSKDDSGIWKVEVTFKTDEVRKDENNYLRQTREFEI